MPHKITQLEGNKDAVGSRCSIYLALTTFETRRLRGALIEVFNIFKSFENLDSFKFF